jgi:quinone-reactive Ni/Fe-hydrogenase small subunit
MRIVIVGGGIAAAYLANNIKKRDSSYEVVIVSDEKFPPYDRIHLCCLINDKANVNDIKIPIDPTVSIELNQQIKNIDTKNRKIFSQDSMFSYDKLII